MRFILLTLTLLAAGEAMAQKAIYKWTDKDGTSHFTDDVKYVPKGIKVETTVGDDLSLAYATPDPKAAPAAKVEPKEPAPQEVAEKQRQQAEWRRRFAEARRDVQRLEDDVESDRKSTHDGSSAVSCVSASTQVYGSPCIFGLTFRRDQQDRDKRSLVRAKEHLAELERQAANEGIPHEWRRGFP